MQTFEEKMESQQKSFEEADYKKGYITTPGKYSCSIMDVKIKEDKFGWKANWFFVILDGKDEDGVIVSNTPLEGEAKHLQFVKRYIGALGEDPATYQLKDFAADIDKWKKYIIEVKVTANTKEGKENFPWVDITKVLSGMDAPKDLTKFDTEDI